MGLLGLTPRSSNFTSFNNPIPSFMQSLQEQSLIPSVSWSYTAGNQYRNFHPFTSTSFGTFADHVVVGLSKVFGSLVLGGYDSSRFIQNNYTFPFSVDTGLVTQLEAITTGTGQSLLPSPITLISLDSTLPYIYLPLEACTLFENEFGLTWNETAQLYLLSDAQHSALQTRNPSITFRLGTSPTTVNITLPYAAFDLNASWPLTSSATPYFPLKRSINDTYILGRTFFQEAYVIADYEAGSFSVSQCKWDGTLSQNIITILPSNSTNSTSPTPETSHSLPTGAIAGISVAGAAVAVVAVLIFYLYRLKPARQKKHAAELAANTPSQQEAVLKPELENTAIPSPQIYEADSGKNRPPVEIGESGARVYELPAREEAASEMNEVNEPRAIIERRNHVFHRG